MKERPILFKGEMVRAVLNGSKTQTRRTVKPQPETTHEGDPYWHIGGYRVWAYRSACDDILRKGGDPLLCPYGRDGDHLYVRETFAKIMGQSGVWIETDYHATYKHGDRLGDSLGVKKKWTPSIHMPRWASRITLEITDVRVERLQEISRGDAMAEGCPFPNMAKGDDPRQWYADLWKKINGADSWDANPWVWVIEFRKLKKP